MTAILLGSISTVADTSELQRDSFNRAFAEHGLDWHWDRDAYRAMLAGNGGRDRVAEFARSRGDQVDADAVHASKSRFFQQALSEVEITPRDGVGETVRRAQEAGVRVALVTTTSAENVAALTSALSGHLDLNGLDLVVDSGSVSRAKPDPAAYLHALEQLGEEADACVAVEDNPGGARSAAAAGLRCVAFPNLNTAGLDFDGVIGRRERLDLADLQEVLAAG